MITSLIKFLIDPFNLLWILLLVTTGAWLLKRGRLFSWLTLSTGAWFLLISTPLLPNLVLNSLEDRYEPVYIEEIADPEAEYHILVLGGGHGFDDRLPSNSLLSHNALYRLNEGIRLHRQLPNSKLVLSGSTSTPGRTTQAEMLQQTALLLGVEEEATLLQDEPKNTYDEVAVYTKTYGNTHPVILITSAVHMSRAVLMFKQQGIRPVASPTNFRLLGSWKRKWFGLPAMRNIENLRVGIYEYVAMLGFRY